MTRSFAIHALCAALLAVAAYAVACDLNPQPLPPGEQADAATGSTGGSGDKGNGQSDSGMTSSPGSADAGALPPPLNGLDGGGLGAGDGGQTGAADATVPDTGPESGDAAANTDASGGDEDAALMGDSGGD